MLEINRIYNEDCLLTMGNMPNEFIDLTITSPLGITMPAAIILFPITYIRLDLARQFLL